MPTIGVATYGIVRGPAGDGITPGERDKIDEAVAAANDLEVALPQVDQAREDAQLAAGQAAGDRAAAEAARIANETALSAYDRRVLYKSAFSTLDGWVSETTGRATVSVSGGALRMQGVAGQSAAAILRRSPYLTMFSGRAIRITVSITATSPTLQVRPRVRWRNAAGEIVGPVFADNKSGWAAGVATLQSWDLQSPGDGYTEVEIALQFSNYAANPAYEVINSVMVEDATIDSRLPKAVESETIRAAQSMVTLGLNRLKTGDLLWKPAGSDAVLTTADGRGWIPSGAVTPEHFGAVGDADETAMTGTDDTLALRLAMEWCARNRRWLVLTSKYMRDNSTLTLSPSIGGMDLRIRGDAGNAIICPDTSTARRDALVLASAAPPRDVTLRGVNFVGPWSQGVTADGSNFLSGQWIRELDIDGCTFTGSKRGAVGCTGPTGTFAYRARIRNCKFSMNATGGGGIRNCKICMVDGNHFEYGWDDYVGVHNDDGEYTLDRIHIVTNNTFYQCQGICASGGASTTISNNRFSMCFGRAIGVFGWATFHSLTITGNVIENMFNQELMSGVLVPRSDAIYVTLQTAVNNLGLPGYEWESNGAGGVQTPYGNYYKVGRTEGVGTKTRAASPMHSVLIDGNVITRTLPPAASWSEYGLPQQIRTRLGPYTGEITRAMMLDRGIRFEGGSRGCRISNNIVDGAAVCIDASEYQVGETAPVSNHKALSIVGNTLRNFSDSAIRFFGVSGDAAISLNEFDGDPLFESASRNADGTWNFSGAAACGALYGSDASNLALSVYGNSFRNLRRIVEGSIPQASFSDNRLFCDPVSDDEAAGNIGIGGFGGSISRVGQLIVEQGNPALPNFGRVTSRALHASSAVPSTGKYARGHFVRNLAPTPDGSGAVITGWLRLTTGSGHVLGTDWRAIVA